MIVVDTSALMAIVLGEESADACAAALESHGEILISTATVAESLIVADHRDVGTEMRRLIDGLGFEIIPVTQAVALHVADSYRRWGKGAHPAALNFGDCFAYVTAKDRDCALLYVGRDFARTDVASVLGEAAPGA